MQTLFPAGRRRRAQADHGPLVHTERPDHSARGRERGGAARQVAAGEATADTVVGSPGLETSDSAIKARPVFHTDAGRVVRGGGGIVPDIVITLGYADRGRARVRQGARRQPARVSRRADDDGAGGEERRAPSRRSRSRSRPRCGARSTIAFGPRASRSPRKSSTVRGAWSTTSSSYELARYVFGRPAEFRRRCAERLARCRRRWTCSGARRARRSCWASPAASKAATSARN